MGDAKYQREWRKKNPDKVKKHNDSKKKEKRAWKIKNKENLKKKNIERLYKIKYEEYLQMLADTNGICPICKREFDFETNDDSKSGPNSRMCPCVDHNHDTGVVRGIICGYCNCALGGFRDDIDALKNAVKYLEGK